MLRQILDSIQDIDILRVQTWVTGAGRTAKVKPRGRALWAAASSEAEAEDGNDDEDSPDHKSDDGNSVPAPTAGTAHAFPKALRPSPHEQPLSTTRARGSSILSFAAVAAVHTGSAKTGAAFSSQLLL